MITPEHARGSESRAVDHLRHGRVGEAVNEYRNAARQWEAVADRLARYGETLVAQMFRQEASKCRRKADATIWEAVE